MTCSSIYDADCRQVTQTDSAIMPISSQVPNQVDESIYRNPMLKLAALAGYQNSFTGIKTTPNIVKLGLLQDATPGSFLQDRSN